ncbi:hypothetical protein V6R86_12355 [Sphingomonas kaistensis]|uniref:Uncharacterized protein n=1 Tax=Sphingomonas kaistensis TaxID=298708 RepID=A0ABZ2G380_9SPHN
MTPEEIAKELRRPRAPLSVGVIGIFVMAIAVLIMLGLTSGTSKL